jgi:tight adherence protein C
MGVPAISIPLLVIFFVAAAIAAYQVMPKGKRQEIAHMGGIHGVEADEISPLITAMRPIFGLFVPITRWIKVEGYRKRVETQFVTAGMSGALSTDEFIAYKLIMSVAFWALFVKLFAGVIVGWEVPWYAQVVAAGFGTLFPDAWLSGQVRERQDSMRRSLPYVLDLLTLSVEAGLDFVAGIHKVCEKSRSGPLVDELSFFLGEMQVGATRQQALRNLAQRTEMQEIRSFCAMLVQADMLGASVGPVLRAQSDLLRTQRFQRAEQAGAYASQKILFPLILCIMPAVFIIIFGPIVLNFVYGDQTIGI